MKILEQKHIALLKEAQRHNLPHTDNMLRCFEVLALASAIDKDCQTRLGEHGLSEGRFVLLFLLHAEAEGLTPAELSERAGVTRSTITGLLDGLAKEGFLERKADPQDRRKIMVRLTAQGRILTEQLFEQHSRWIASLFADFSPQDKALLSALLLRVWRKTELGERYNNPLFFKKS
ncbi:MAG: MarR family winged helix-turn-helix transcriptional regulator [Enterobacteriaceae bacterium]